MSSVDTITATKLRRPGDILNRCSIDGETLSVTRHGVEVAVICGPKQSRDAALMRIDDELLRRCGEIVLGFGAGPDANGEHKAYNRICDWIRREFPDAFAKEAE